MPGPKKRNIVKVVTPTPRTPEKPESVKPTTEPVSEKKETGNTTPPSSAEPTEPPSAGPTEPPSERPTEPPSVGPTEPPSERPTIPIPVSAPVESKPPPPAIRFPKPAPLPTIPMSELHASEFPCSHLLGRKPTPKPEEVPATVRSQRMVSEKPPAPPPAEPKPAEPPPHHPPTPSGYPRESGDPASPPRLPVKAKTWEMISGVIAVLVVIVLIFGWAISTVKGCSSGKNEEQTPPPPIPTTSAVPAPTPTPAPAPQTRVCMPANSQNVARYLYQTGTCIKGELEDPAPDTLSVYCSRTPPTGNGCTEIAKCEICLPEGYEAGKQYPLTRKTLRGFTAQGDPACYVEPANISFLSASRDALRIDCPGTRPYNAVRKCLDLSNCSLIIPPIVR